MSVSFVISEGLRRIEKNIRVGVGVGVMVMVKVGIRVGVRVDYYQYCGVVQ